MNDSEFDKLDRDAIRAYTRLSHRLMAPDEFAELERRLLEDEPFRQAYVAQVDLEAELETNFRSLPHAMPIPGGEADSAISEVSAPARREHPVRHSPILWLAVSLCLLLGIGLLSYNSWWNPGRTAPRIEYVEARLSGLRPIAIVTDVQGDDPLRETLLKRGSRIKPGIIHLPHGELQLEFLSGVLVRLYGPAEMHLLSNESATLVEGRVAVVAPPDSRSFTLNGPVSTIVDGPAELTYHLEGQDSGTIDVYQGEVMVSLLGQNGDTLLNELIKVNQSARFHGRSLDVTEAQFAEADRSRVLPIDDQSLGGTDDYARMIQADQPLVYWRFEEREIAGDRIRNQMSDRYAAQIHGGEDGSIEVRGGALHLAASPDSRYLQLEESIERLNEGDFTLEFWVRPRRMHWATILGILPVEQLRKDQESHLSVIEYANQTNLVHRPATIRFLHRYPPTTYDGGLNVFSAESCTPGLWNHVVAVKTSESIRLYFNGELRLIQDDLKLGDQQAYSVILGQLDSIRSERQFEGQIAEVAIYRKALDQEDVLRHYRQMMGDRVF